MKIKMSSQYFLSVPFIGLVVIGLFLSFSANAAFIGVLPATPSGTDWQAYYDDQLDITWTANANLHGEFDWLDQTNWVAGLTINGVGGWRLPNIDINEDAAVINCSSGTQAACMDNEFGHLFYYGAGTTLNSGITFVSPGPFSDIQNAAYWTATEAAFNPSGFAWVFRMGLGSQGPDDKGDLRRAWAVHDGNISGPIVPVPAAVWLFGSALGLLGWMRRKAS